jgi:hypothetical protein
MSSKFSYHNKEIRHSKHGHKIVRHVSIKNGKGYKSVTKYFKKKKVHTAKKPIHKSHINMIKLGKFIPNFFSDCGCNKKTRKNRK